MSYSPAFSGLAAPTQQPKLLQRMRDHLRTRHDSIRTETADSDGVQRFNFNNAGSRHSVKKPRQSRAGDDGE